MVGSINKCFLADLFHIVKATSYVLPVSASGKVKSILYVPGKYELGKELAEFTTKQNDSGYYLLSPQRSSLIYCSFILNSGIGMLYMNDKEEAQNSTKGSVTIRKLGGVVIYQISERYTKACNVLELIIARVRRLEVEEQAQVARDATLSFLENMRAGIALEIYMNTIFESRQVSILEPWTKFIEEQSSSYKVNLIDNVFINFYKSITDPDNAIMDAMKKAKMFMWELMEILKNKRP